MSAQVIELKVTLAKTNLYYKFLNSSNICQHDYNEKLSTTKRHLYKVAVKLWFSSVYIKTIEISPQGQECNFTTSLFARQRDVVSINLFTTRRRRTGSEHCNLVQSKYVEVANRM